MDQNNARPQAGVQAAWTAEFMRRHFPMVPSTRRLNRDLFEGWIAAEALRDETRFYDALSRFVREAPQRVWTFDERVIGQGDKGKAFRVRARNALRRHPDARKMMTDFLLAPDTHFPEGSEERALHAFLKHVEEIATNSGAIPHPVTEAGHELEDGGPRPEEAAEIHPGWEELAEEVAILCHALRMPSVEAAAAIVAAAERLRDACLTAETVEQLRANWCARRDDLVDRLAVLGITMPALGSQEAPGDHVVAEAEARILAAEVAQREFKVAEAHQAEVMRRWDAADTASDYEAISGLLPIRKDAQANLKAALAAKEATFAACALPMPDGQGSVPSVAEQPTTILVPASDSEPREAAGELASFDDEPEAAAPSFRAPEVSSGVKAAVVAQADEAFGMSVEEESQPADLVQLLGNSAVSEEERAPSSLLVLYLERGEPEFAFHLAALAEEAGERPALPSAILAALVHARRVQQPHDVADTAFQQLLAEAMSALASVEREGSDEWISATRILVFSALLRPALFDFARVARGHLGRLSMMDALQPYAAFAAELAGLGFDVEISREDLVKLRGRERGRRTPAARERLLQWLEAGRTARTSHQPTSAILHALLGSEGVIGAVVEAALQDEAQAPGRVRDLLDRLADNERFIDEVEQGSGRPRRDRIHGQALAWIKTRLDEGREGLEGWRAAKAADAVLGDDRRREALQRYIGALTKDLDALPTPRDVGEPGLAGAVARLLNDALTDFKSLLRGETGPEFAGRPADPLRVALLRLPAPSLPLAPEQEAFQEERQCQREALLKALHDPACIAVDLHCAFAARLKEKAAAAAAEILHHVGDDADMRQSLDEVVSTSRIAARRRIQGLQQDLATLLNLDVASGEKVREHLDRLALIGRALSVKPLDSPTIPSVGAVYRDPSVPPDFPELDRLLGVREDFRDMLRERIRMEQLGRLAGLAEVDAAREVTARARTLDPVTLDDMIAELEAGRDPLAPEAGDRDLFKVFMPGFVEVLAGARSVTLGQVIAAAERRDRAGPFDFTGLDPAAADRGKDLVAAWDETANALRNRKSHRLKDPVGRLLGLIGLTGVRLEDDRVLDPGRLHRLRLACNVPKPGRWFLPPEFGSIAAGTYRLLLASSAVEHSQLATAIGEEPDQPWIVLRFQRLDQGQRVAQARVLRGDRRAALTLDEGLLLHLATTNGDLLERFVASAAPFAWVQPYTTNPRSIPPEMFFGRREEMERIIARRSEGCLIYGGRQLGKSAMLNQVRLDQHRPNAGQVALYLDIGDVGEQPVPTSEVWRRIGDALSREAGIASQGQGGDGVLAAMREWLDVVGDRRILVMLDEADHFLAGEHPNYPNLRRLKDLMEATGWRFKAVFAGLHNVRRLARASNSPLVHLGEPICVGPMNTTPANQRELRRLVREPMRAAGYDYDPPDLAADILARVNHYPSLVQVFCKEVIEAAAGRTRELAGAPRWNLVRETLFEGQLPERIAGEIRKRFQWTLDLDPRYDLIAKTLALHRLDDTDGHSAVLRDGLAAEVIRLETEEWWPNGLPRVSLEDFRELLDEMADLGVLGKKAGGRFGLRNAHVAQMLGSREAVHAELLALWSKEAPADYDAGAYHRRADPADTVSLSPFPDRMLTRLLAREGSQVRIVVAPPELWGANVAERLESLARGWEEDGRTPRVVLRRLEGLEARVLQGNVRREVERATGAPLVIMLDSPLNKPLLDWLVVQPQLCDGRVRVIWILDGEGAKQAVRVAGTAVFRAPLLTDNMLRHWLRGAGFSRLDDAETRGAVRAASGGIVTRLVALRPLLVELEPESPARRVASLSRWAQEHRLPDVALGLSDAQLKVFREVAMVADGPSGGARPHIVELVPAAETALPDMEEAGLLERLADDHLRLTPLGLLVVR